MSESNKKQNLVFNRLRFEITEESVEIGIYTEFKRDLKCIKPEYLPKKVKNLLNKDVEYVYISTKTEDAPYKIALKLREEPELCSWFYNDISYHQLLKDKNIRITHRGFTNAWTYWYAPPQKKSSTLKFSRFTLYFKRTEKENSMYCYISIEGLSEVIKQSLSKIQGVNGVNSYDYGRVIYEKQSHKFNKLPEDIQAKTNEIYPILNLDLGSKLKIKSGLEIHTNKVQHYIKTANEVLTKFLNTETFIAIVPHNGQWHPTGTMGQIRENNRSLVFNNNVLSKNVYSGLKSNGPFKLPQKQHHTVFIISSPGMENFKNNLINYIKSSEGRSAPLQTISHLLLNYDPDLDICAPPEELEQAITTQIQNIILDPNTNYYAFYLSPYDKYNTTDLEQQLYYRVKERLLKRNIMSQVIDYEKARDTNLNYWIANMGMAMIAKMGGVPWKLATEEKNEFIVGFGAFRSKNSDTPFVGSAFCFDTQGRFQEFDCWSAKEEYMLIGNLEEAIRKYKQRNGNPSRIIIHYYKDLNKKEFRQVDKLLDRLDYNIPVVVVRINSTFQHQEVVADLSKNHCNPKNGSYYHVHHHSYLLYINDITTSNTICKKGPLPLKVSLQSNTIGYVTQPEVVKEIMQQLHDFSLLHWRSVAQPRLPVTLVYPQYLARIFPNFRSETLQGCGRERLWFL